MDSGKLPSELAGPDAFVDPGEPLAASVDSGKPLAASVDSGKPLAPPDALVGAGMHLSPLHCRVIAVAEVLLCSDIPTQVAVAQAIALAGWSPTTADGALSLPFVVAWQLGDTVVLVALMAWLMRLHGQRPSALWLGHRSIAREAIFGVALVPLIFAVVIVVLGTIRVFAPQLHNVPTNPLEQLAAGGTANAIAFGFAAIVAGGIREELQRAFLLQRFEQHLGGAGVGVLVLSVAFGLGHYNQGWDAVVTTGTLGAIWAIVYLRRRSSVAPVVSHAGFNSLEILRVATLGT